MALESNLDLEQSIDNATKPHFVAATIPSLGLPFHPYSSRNYLNSSNSSSSNISTISDMDESERDHQDEFGHGGGELELNFQINNSNGRRQHHHRPIGINSL